jgi:C4-dicarboxylate-specific signal transduction histidine kinase
MVNLLVNACEGDGSRCAKSVIVSVTSDTPARGLVTFELTDDGPGFSVALLEASTRGGLTTKTTGTGLGLSLVAHIVEASGGTVHLRNLPESGASVSISLRAAPVR